MSKYGAKKITIGGITFDSHAEARRYGQLINQERAGIITCLCRQVPYVLAPAVLLAGAKRTKPALRYMADFVYLDQAGKTVVEDVKGVITPVFRLKQHLMKTVHGIDIRLTT